MIKLYYVLYIESYYYSTFITWIYNFLYNLSRLRHKNQRTKQSISNYSFKFITLSNTFNDKRNQKRYIESLGEFDG